MSKVPTSLKNAADTLQRAGRQVEDVSLTPAGASHLAQQLTRAWQLANAAKAAIHTMPAGPMKEGLSQAIKAMQDAHDI